MTIRSSHDKRRNTTVDWLWLFVKVVLAGAALGLGAGWLKDNVAPEARWFIFPMSFVLFLAVSIPLVFGVRIKIPGLKRAKRTHEEP